MKRILASFALVGLTIMWALGFYLFDIDMLEDIDVTFDEWDLE